MGVCSGLIVYPSGVTGSRLMVPGCVSLGNGVLATKDFLVTLSQTSDLPGLHQWGHGCPERKVPRVIAKV